VDGAARCRNAEHRCGTDDLFVCRIPPISARATTGWIVCVKRDNELSLPILEKKMKKKPGMSWLPITKATRAATTAEAANRADLLLQLQSVPKNEQRAYVSRSRVCLLRVPPFRTDSTANGGWEARLAGRQGTPPRTRHPTFDSRHSQTTHLSRNYTRAIGHCLRKLQKCCALRRRTESNEVRRSHLEPASPMDGTAHVLLAARKNEQPFWAPD
jgi:hypothetical protein